MKTVALLLVLAVSGLCWLALAETGLFSSNSLSLGDPFKENAPFEWKLPNTNFCLPQFEGAKRLFCAPAPTVAPGTPPAPGVYKAGPYTALVLVPGPHPDDKCIHWPGATDRQMPVKKPELRLVPYKANQK